MNIISKVLEFKDRHTINLSMVLTALMQTANLTITIQIQAFFMLKKELLLLGLL